MIDKRVLIEGIVAKLTEELETLNRAVRAAHEAATHEESKAEDQYDTRGLEASYLASAQANRAAELQSQINLFKFLPIRDKPEAHAVEVGSLVELDLDGRKLLYFLVSQGGGISIRLESATVQVITPLAPLGEALLGRRVGEVVEVELQDSVREYEVLAVS